MAWPTETVRRAFSGEMHKRSADLSHMAGSLLGGLLAETPLRRRLPGRWPSAARDALTGAVFGAGASLGGQVVDRQRQGRPISATDVGSTVLFAGAASPLVSRYLR